MELNELKTRVEVTDFLSRLSWQQLSEMLKTYQCGIEKLEEKICQAIGVKK